MPHHIPYFTVLGQATVDALAAHQLGRICQPKYVGGAREGEAEIRRGVQDLGRLEMYDGGYRKHPPPSPQEPRLGGISAPSKQALLRI